MQYAFAYIARKFNLMQMIVMEIINKCRMTE